MPIVSRVAAMTSQAWGQFKNTLVSLAGNYLYVWSANTSAALGIGTVSATVNRSSPVQISFGKDYSQMHASSAFFGVTSSGQLWATGLGTNGLLGDGAAVSKSSPVQIGTLTNWSQASTGSIHSHAVKTDGTLWAWGNAMAGALGNGTTTPTLSSPVQIGTLTDWAKVSVGRSFAIAVKTDGTLWSWGWNQSGYLGDGTTTNRSSPVQIGTLTDWDITNGNGTRLYNSVVKTDGTLWSWGSNAEGALGTGTTAQNRSSPVQVGTLSNWSFTVQAQGTVLGVKTDGTLWAWGLNNNGQLGQGDTITRSSPVQIGTQTDWSLQRTDYIGGNQYFIARKQDGTLWAWGTNSNGNFGNGTTVNTSSPIQIGTSTNYSILADSAALHNFYKTTDGSIFGTGINTGATYSGILGQVEANFTTPIQIGRGIGNRKYSFASTRNEGGIAIDTLGKLWTWGSNTAGQLGNGTTNAANDSVSLPTQIGTLTNWRKAYAQDSIALNSLGDMYSWGGIPTNTSVNYYLGFGGYSNTFNYPQRFTPYTISSFAGFNNSGTGKHILFVTSAGKLYGQGANNSGQIGDGTTITKSAPVQIGTLTNWSKVATIAGNGASTGASAAIKTDGTLWTWGRGQEGQLGDGTTVDKSSPVQIGTLTNWTDIASLLNGFSALNSNGELYSWGVNDLSGATGDLGIGSSTRIDSSFSVPLQYGQIDFTDLSVGQVSTNFAMGVDSGNRLWTWGLNSSGQLGFGDTTKRNSSAVQLGTLTNWSKVSASGSTAMAIKTDGTLWGWGANNLNQLGLGGTDGTANRSSPVQMAYYNKVQELYGLHGVIGGTGYAKIDGDLYAWGYNAGLGLVGSTAAPYNTNVSGNIATSLVNTRYGNDWSKISSADSFTLGIKTDGTLWAWGENTYGQLGNGIAANYSSPTQIGTLTNWAFIETAHTTSYAVKTDGTLWAWGRNQLGQLGDGTTTNRSSPVQIGTLTTWATVGAGQGFAGFVTTDNKLFTVGYNSTGQLGLGDTTDRSSPVQVGTLSDWSIVCGSDANLYAIKTNGTLWSWGSGASGALGNNSTTDRSSPVQIGTLTTWSTISASGLSAGAIKNDGTLWTWGRNDYGQLADGSTTNRSSPIQVGTLTNWSKLYFYYPNLTGTGFAALTTDGTLYAAGYNTDGFGGNGFLGYEKVPTQYSPVQIGTTSTWAELAAIQGASSGGTAAIRSGGSLWTWGTGNEVLGQGAGATPKLSPVQVGTLTNWSKLSGGTSFALALKTDGTLWAWGRGEEGQLGDGTTVTKSSPVQIGTLTSWSKISAGLNSSLAVNNSGTLFTWGNNSYGQLGDNTQVAKSSPIQIATSVSSASMGSVNMAYVTTGGAIFNTGTAVINSTGNSTAVSSPIQIPAVTTYNTSFIVASYNFLAAKSTENNYLYIWAGSSVGNPTTGSFAFPGVYEAGKSSPTQIKSSAPWTSARGLQSPGYLYTWGRSNSGGNLGLGDTFVRLGVTRVGTVNTWTKTAQPNLLANIALRADGSLWTWGANASGQLGQGDTTGRSVPTQVGTLTNWTDVSSSESQQFAVNSSNQLWGVGSNSNYALGDGTTTNRSTFVQSGFSSDNVSYSSVVAVKDGGFATNTSGRGYTWGEFAGVNFSDVYSPTATGDTGFTTQYVKNGGLYMAGQNNYGQLGTGDAFVRTNATRIGTLTNWAIVESRLDAATIAIKTDGTLWSWGLGSLGRLGNGSTTNLSSPVQVGTLTNWSKISIASASCLAIKTDGTLWAWGANSSGQLGDGTTTNRSSPVQIGTLTNWASVNAFAATSEAVKTDGTLWTWGGAANGQLGNGTTTPNLSSPVQVGTLTTWVSTFDNESGGTPVAFSTQ